MLSLINVRQLHRDLYRAENLSDALRIIFLSGPRWLPWVGAGMFFTAYMTFLRVRILISRFRRAARARAERKFFALGLPCDCVTPPPCTLFTKIGDGNDEDDGIVSLEKNDATVTLADIEEFCFVLGLRDSRDDDLFTIVTKMLLVDDIPEGWALYRKSTGELRFLNFSTQELSFFHPGKRKEELYIRKELDDAIAS
ncbi:hypothetical protein ERJ75_000749900 [Trypanosoma vivax]|nr:hypothetical protein ERJ75_000749900 [Trypanosoma vivax]